MPHFDSLQRQLQQAARDLAGTASPGNGAFRAMANEPEVLGVWWEGVFPADETEAAQLDSAALAYANGRPWPELSPAQRGRMALRLRLAARVLRAMRDSDTIQSKGWFPARLHTLPTASLLEWLLVHTWPIWSEILDETLCWAGEFEHPPERSHRPRSRGPATGGGFSG